MDAATRDFVRRRAGGRCEYCLLPLESFDVSHHVEHIVAKQQGGGDETGNLALACHLCNLHKQPSGNRSGQR
jgi:5-methylcytosine-specific restriction endonuclease McrA